MPSILQCFALSEKYDLGISLAEEKKHPFLNAIAYSSKKQFFKICHQDYMSE